MDRGTYAGASFGFKSLRLLDVVSNNLANVNTTGYKRQFIVQRDRSFQSTLASTIENNTAPYAALDHQRYNGVTDVETRTDFSIGPIKYTGNNLDVALEKADHFFVVQRNGADQYTRAGNFQISSTGQLVTSDGSAVLGEGGPITVAGKPTITSDGSILVNGQISGRVRVVQINDPETLTRADGTRFAIDNDQQPVDVQPELATNSLEQANISIADSMVQLINASRGFQLYTKVASSIDKLNEQAGSRLGRTPG